MSISSCATCTDHWSSMGKRTPCLGVREIVKKRKCEACILIRSYDIWSDCPFLCKRGNEFRRIIMDAKYPQFPLFTGPQDQAILRSIADDLQRLGLDRRSRDLDQMEGDAELRTALSLGASGPFLYSPHLFPVYFFYMGFNRGYSWDTFSDYYFNQVLPDTMAVSGWKLTGSAGGAVAAGPGFGGGQFTVQHYNDKTFKADPAVTLMYNAVVGGAKGASGSLPFFPSVTTDIYLGSLAKDNIELQDLRGSAVMCDTAVGLIAGQSATWVWFGTPDNAPSWGSRPGEYSIKAIAFARFLSTTVGTIIVWSPPNYYSLNVW